MHGARPKPRSRARSLALGALLALAGCTAKVETAREVPAGEPAPCPDAGDLARPGATGRNPLSPTPANLVAGQQLYQRAAEPIACADCHGSTGQGDGPIGRYLDPRPTNLSCLEPLAAVSDEALFAAIKYGAEYAEVEPGQGLAELRRPGRRDRPSAMRAHEYSLTDEEIWQIVLYLRTLADGERAAPAAAGDGRAR